LIKANITSEESILQNLNEWCYEVGSEFEHLGEEAALEFIKFMTQPHVLELGCGDGASVRTFIDNNIKVFALDINPYKLLRLNGALIWEIDMLTGLKQLKKNTVQNIFCHHSLEHVVDADKVIEEISRVMKKKGLFYVTVPANDYLHSVHHVVFESPLELLPKGFKPIILEERTRTYNSPVDNKPIEQSEYVCIAQKLV
jgi:ubiquinone/menaquinone biosynthesis C-methylase UbiE